MKKKIRITHQVSLLAGTIVALGGCTEYKIRQFDTVTPAGPAFNQFLAQYYGDLAKKKAHERYDQAGGLKFIEKASDAAEPKPILPEDPSKYRLHEEDRPLFENARAQLLQVLNSGARDGNPQVAASAQVNYDCWLFQQALEMDDDFLKSCKDMFDQSMQVLTGNGMVPQEGGQVQADGSPVAGQPVMMNQGIPVQVQADGSVVAGQPVMMGPGGPEGDVSSGAPQPQPMTSGGGTYDHAFFPLNSARITPQASQALDAIIGEIQRVEAQQGQPVSVTIVGHTDSTGSENRNIDLSLRRAYAARGYLHERGITADRVNIDGRGSSEPLITQASGVPEPRNRRVDIYIHG